MPYDYFACKMGGVQHADCICLIRGKELKLVGRGVVGWGGWGMTTSHSCR